MALHKIDRYSFGKISVDGRQYTSDLIIMPDRIHDNWWRKEGHSLAPEDLEVLMESPPEMLIVGRGAYGVMKIPASTKNFIESKEIDLIAAKTGDAVERYNKESAAGKNVAAALHLTC